MLLVLALAAVQGCGQQAQTPQTPQEPAVKDVILATTTSTQDSGLLDAGAKFEEKTGYKVKQSLLVPEQPWPWVRRAKPMCCCATPTRMK